MPNSDYAAEDIAAAKYPEMVRKLVLYAPIVAELADVEVTAPFNHNTWIHTAGDFQVNADKSINYDITEPEVVSTFQSNCWRYDKDSSPNGGRRDLLVSPEKRLIPTEKLTMPVLIIVGSKDDYVSPELCNEAFGTLTNKKSRIEIIEGAAHAMMMEKPYYKQFRSKVLSFLRAR